MSNLEKIVNDAGKIIKDDFGLSVENTSIKAYDKEIWDNFCERNGFNKDSEGLYVPISNIAYVDADSKHLISNLFHEYFGHGIYCEKSIIGKPLSKFTSNEESDDFLYSREIANKQLFGIAPNNFGNYEGFALWLESYLCRKTGYQDVWLSKKSLLPKEFSELSEYFEYAEKKITTFGLISQMGLPKHYDAQTVLDTLFHLTGEQYKESTIILYGSRKPDKDIDLFIISNNKSNNYYNGWLDIYGVNQEEFTYKINNLDISITDPLFSGEVIYGDNDLVEKARTHVQTIPITEHIIQYNINESKKQKEIIKMLPQDSREYQIGLKYAESYEKNAFLLERGIKPFTYIKAVN